MTSADDRARAALRHPDLAWVMNELPPEYRDNPAVIRHLMTVAANASPEFARSPAYHAAAAATSDLGRERDFRDRVARAYYDPKIRAKFGAARVEAAWADPEAALAELRSMSVAGGLSPALNEALDVIYEARQFATETGGTLSGPPPAVAPIPSDPATADAERAALVEKSVSGQLSKAENTRLNQLYEAQVTRETGAPLPADKPAAQSERARLVSKSVAGKLNSAEDARLTQLYEAKVIADGTPVEEVTAHKKALGIPSSPAATTEE
ncbi:MAG TPA: hypothetical protein VEK82_14835 [Stellaceae bacterium]|nr:hypothetical protein [Stellaceae bacterium]